MKEHFVIPTNFMETGYIMNGAVSIRNAVEAGVLALLGFFVCRMLPLPGGFTDAITYYILICGPLGLVGLYGVQGDPLSVFVFDFIKWRRRRKPSFYSEHGEAYTQEAADLLWEAPQMRDMLADAVDKMRSKMAAVEIDYVEGETFQFAADPERDALREAQREISEKREAEIEKLREEQRAREAELAAKNNPFRKQESSKTVNASELSGMLVLDELNWEEDE